MDDIEFRISGIPCLIVVDECTIVPPWPGSAHTAPSDLDYTGYTEVEYTVCDTKGRPAPWLAKKMTDQERIDIETKIVSIAKERDDDGY